MFLRCTKRTKAGKEHSYWSLVENKRVSGGRVVQRHVLYLGEINDSQQEAWRKSIEVFEEGKARPTTIALFPEERIEAHIFVSFLAYCLHVTLGRQLRDLAPGLTPRSVLEKFSAMQMIDVHLPTSDGREVVLTRYTQPERDLELLLRSLKLELPPQPPPKITVTDLPAD